MDGVSLSVCGRRTRPSFTRPSHDDDDYFENTIKFFLITSNVSWICKRFLKEPSARCAYSILLVLEELLMDPLHVMDLKSGSCI